MGQTTRQRPSAEEALQALLEGNGRFVSENLLYPNHFEESRQGVASGHDSIAVVPGHSSCGAIGAAAGDVKMDGHMSGFVPPHSGCNKDRQKQRGEPGEQYRQGTYRAGFREDRRFGAGYC